MKQESLQPMQISSSLDTKEIPAKDSAQMRPASSKKYISLFVLCVGIAAIITLFPFLRDSGVNVSNRPDNIRELISTASSRARNAHAFASLATNSPIFVTDNSMQVIMIFI